MLKLSGKKIVVEFGVHELEQGQKLTNLTAESARPFLSLTSGAGCSKPG